MVDIGQIALACLFLTVWIADGFVFQYTTQINQYLPFGVRLPIATVLVLLSLRVVWLAHKQLFHAPQEKPCVIRHGIYGRVRHPIYLSELVFYLGLIVLNVSLAALAVWLLGFGFLHYIARYEEKLLLARFGQEYAKYMQDVPMWFHRFAKRRT